MLVFFVELFFITPAKVYREEKNASDVKSRRIENLTNEVGQLATTNNQLLQLIQTKDAAFQTQSATASALQAQLSQIIYERDTSKVRVKKKAQLLAKEIWDFCAEWDANEPP